MSQIEASIESESKTHNKGKGINNNRFLYWLRILRSFPTPSLQVSVGIVHPYIPTS